MTSVDTRQSTVDRAAPTLVRPYGDTTGDGMVQLSFTLPVPQDGRAEGAALQLAAKMGLEPAMVVHAKGMGPAFTFFVVYGRVNHLVDLSAVAVVEREYPLLPAKEVNLAIRELLRRKLIVLGACIGTDAHTVGIDAILNVKGFAGEKGLEYYREIKVVNLGAQVLVDELVARARAERADAILVSQVVTQKDAHLHNTRELADAVQAAEWSRPGPPLLVVGGPRFDPAMAGGLGVDRIFGKGTTPAEVASYLVHWLRQGGRGAAQVPGAAQATGAAQVPGAAQATGAAQVPGAAQATGAVSAEAADRGITAGAARRASRGGAGR